MIYVVQGPKNYLKLCDKPGARHNRFGLIENNGTLNIKLGQLPKVPRTAPTFVKSPNGSTKGVGGVNYDGWIVFPSQADALKYLSHHYDIELVDTFVTIRMKNGSPLVIVPGLPSAKPASPSSARKPIDDWFRQLQDVLHDLKKRFCGVDILFKGGGIVPIPDWFRDWCAQEGIEIIVV